MAIGIAMVMVRNHAPLSVVELQRDFAARWPDLPRPTDGIEEDAVLSFKVGSADVIVGIMPAPIPWSDLEDPCRTSIFWRAAAEDLKDHQAHHIVTVSAELMPLELATLLTKATASVVSVAPSALGVYWGSATLVIPRNLFLELAEKVLPLGPPLHIWVDFRVWSREDGTSAGFTSGMAALGLMEFEIGGVPEKPSELHNRLTELAEYVVQNPKSIKDGDTVGRNSQEKIRVRFSKSEHQRECIVMRLTYESGAPKPWWKIW
jgi:hypothetical protein